MIEPEVTAALGRRYAAFLIDSSLVVATGLGVAFQQSTAFTVVGRDGNGEALVDPAEFEMMEELLDFEVLGQSEILGQPVVRAQELGDSVRVFGADSYQVGLLAAVVAAVILFGVVPAILGRTIGMLPLGLGIKSSDGSKASIGAHLFRTLGGFIDAIPFAIPGALGFAVATTSDQRQRLGDRLARTAVVDLEAHRLAEIPTDDIDLHLGSSAQGDAGPPVEAPAMTGTAVTETAVTETAVTETAVTDTPATETAVTEAAATETPITDTPATETATQKPPLAKPAFGDPLPPPPVHRKSHTERPFGSLGDVPDGERAADPAAATEIDAPTASVDEHPVDRPPLLSLDLRKTEADDENSLAVPDRTWQPPREEPAPVWQPTVLETAPVEAPDPHDGRTLDDIVLREPSVGALLSGHAVDLDETATSTSSRPGNHSSSAPSAKTPVWSDKWRAWMYWDTTRKCWLRHDTSTNTWEPVD